MVIVLSLQVKTRCCEWEILRNEDTSLQNEQLTLFTNTFDSSLESNCYDSCNEYSQYTMCNT